MTQIGRSTKAYDGERGGTPPLTPNATASASAYQRVDTLGHQPWPWIRGVMEELCREEARHQGNRGDGHLLALHYDSLYYLFRFAIPSSCYVLAPMMEIHGGSYRFTAGYGWSWRFTPGSEPLPQFRGSPVRILTNLPR